MKGAPGQRWFAWTDELAAHGVDSAEDRTVVRALALDFGPYGSHDEAVVAMSHWIKACGQPPQDVDPQVLRDVAARCPQTRAGRLASKLLA
jgi:hypothetical protein